jgi:CubicO group peptidase (beta-lactamase class C family)
VQTLIQDAIDEQVASGRETGVQVAVYEHGELVVDAVAGLADPATGRRVDSGTIFYTWSMGKAMTAAIVHRLVERGVFGYDTRIAGVWPAYGNRGKEKTTIRHALQHTAGVPGIGTETTVADICDWDRMCARIAAATPWWEPGTRTGYHAYTFGFILGELCRRATGTPIADLLRSEVGAPLGIGDELFFGIPCAGQPRLATMVDAAPSIPEMPDSPLLRVSSPELWPTAQLGNDPNVLAADIPAGGKMTARAIAKLYAALIGDVDGVRLVRPDTLDAILTDRFTGVDEVFGNEATWGLGFPLGRLGGKPGDGTFGYGGSGGTYAYADTRAGLAVAYVKNRQTPDFTAAEEIVNLVAAAPRRPSPQHRAR